MLNEYGKIVGLFIENLKLQTDCLFTSIIIVRDKLFNLHWLL